MTLDELYLEYANEPLTEENYGRLGDLQRQSREEKNMGVFANTSLLLAKYHESMQDYDQAIDILKNSLKEAALEDYSQIVSLIDILVGMLLKTEDFSELEQVLQYRERFLEHKKSYQLMQNFYLAVCYEGLKQNQKAIKCLLDVEDTISNNNLVSKYLKLSLLYILERKIPDAKKMYEHAKVFDPEMKNSMFHLVHADLCFHQGDCVSALEAYQNYFISTKNKFRYLDRFIYISIKLENFQEAIDFYHEYLPVMEKQISKHAKKMFYEAGIELYTTLKDYGTVALLKEKIANLYVKDTFHVDSFSDIYSLFDKTKSSIVHEKPRDVILDVFRQMAELYAFSRLVFLYVSDDGFTTLTFSKGLLMEKQYAYEDIKSTLIDKIMSENEPYLLYSQDDLREIPDYLDQEKMTEAMFCIGKKTNQQVYPNGTLFAFLPDASSFDRANKLFIFGNALIEDKLDSVSYQSQLSKTSIPFRDGLTNLGLGLLTIEKGIVYFLNDLARSLFEASVEFLRFDELQKLISAKHKLYLDDFLHHEIMEISFVFPSGATKILEFRIWHHDLVIYALVQDVSSKKAKDAIKEKESRGHSFYGFKNLIQLENEFMNSNMAKAFLVIKVDNFQTVAKHYEPQVLQNVAKIMEAAAKASAKGNYHDIYAICPDVFVIALKTTDKRIIDRIGKDISAIDFSKQVALPVLTGIGCLLLAKATESYKIVEMLLKLSNMGLKPYEPVLYISKPKTSKDELLASLGQSISIALENQLIVLEYHPIGAWEKREIHFLEAEISSRLLFGNPADFRDSLIKGNLFEKYENTFLKTLIKDIRTYNQNTFKAIGFIYRLDSLIIENHTLFDAFLKDLTKTKSIQKQIVICLDYAGSKHDEFLKAARNLHSQGFRLAIRNWIDTFPGAELDSLGLFSLAFIEDNDLAKVSEVWLASIKNLFSVGLVYDHKNVSLRRSFLQEKKLNLVKGEFYATIPSIRELLSLAGNETSSTPGQGD